jgi:hypothetical protein
VGEPGPEPEEELPADSSWPTDAAAPELARPTGDEDGPGWGCVLAVLLLTIILFVGAGACSDVFDGGDDTPTETTQASSG